MFKITETFCAGNFLSARETIFPVRVHDAHFRPSVRRIPICPPLPLDMKMPSSVRVAARLMLSLAPLALSACFYTNTDPGYGSYGSSRVYGGPDYGGYGYGGYGLPWGVGGGPYRSGYYTRDSYYRQSPCSRCHRNPCVCGSRSSSHRHDDDDHHRHHSSSSSSSRSRDDDRHHHSSSSSSSSQRSSSSSGSSSRSSHDRDSHDRSRSSSSSSSSSSRSSHSDNRNMDNPRFQQRDGGDRDRGGSSSSSRSSGGGGSSRDSGDSRKRG